MLSPQLLEWLREWWRAARPQAWLFPGQNPVNPMSARQLSRAVRTAAQAAGIAKRVSPHTLRHNSECRIIPSGVQMAWRSERLSEVRSHRNRHNQRLLRKVRR
jgi:integrase/recombinase XerD